MFKCKPGCYECCGPVQMDPEFIGRHIEDFQGEIEEVVQWPSGYKTIITKDAACIFLNRKTKKCAIYSDRPKICRDYGIVPKMPCPYMKPNGNPRSLADTKRIERHLKKIIRYASAKKQTRISSHNTELRFPRPPPSED